MSTNHLSGSIRRPGREALLESEAITVSRFAREFTCEMHLTRGGNRADANSQPDMVELSRPPE